MTFRTPLDQVLDRFTMQRVTLVALAGMVLWAVASGALGRPGYSPADIAGSALVSVAVALAVNTVFVRFLKATSDPQSSIITALILVLIVPPGLREHGWLLAGATAFAIASKYVVTVDKQHMFNPAALSVAAIALLFPGVTANWWVGTTAMLPAVVVFGGLVVIKTRRLGAVCLFLAILLMVTGTAAGVETASLPDVFQALRLALLQTALLFFAFIMITDPITVPSGRLLRPAYISFVAVLYASPEFRFLPAGFSPEQALCVANAVSFVLRPKYRLELRQNARGRIGEDIWQFSFPRPSHFAFSPGQYMEWTVPHPRPDARGLRRYLTIASSPADRDLVVVMRVPENCSSYKRALVERGAESPPVIAARLVGDFVLPRDTATKLAFIAGGVGIAPFASMVQDMVENDTRRDVVLVYANRRLEDILFQETFACAARLGVKTVYTLTKSEGVPAAWNGRQGRCTAKLLSEEVPDYKERVFYVSGSQKMVSSVVQELRVLPVPRSRIRTDYFDGSSDML